MRAAGTATVDHSVCFLPMSDFQGEKMSEHWRNWAEKSAGTCACEVSDSPNQQGCLDPSIEDVYSGTAGSIASKAIDINNTTNERNANDRLGISDEISNSGFKTEVSESDSSRRMGKDFSKQNDFDSKQRETAIDAELTVLAFVRLINESGFGEVLTERQLLRQRRAFPSIDAGRGRVKVFACLASLCSRRRRSRKTERIGVSDLAEMIENQRYCCALTGEKLTPENLALDHIVPISEGGSFSVENSQLVTRAVNRAKHTMAQDEFISMCKKVAKHFSSAD
jgi:hypothetical protein